MPALVAGLRGAVWLSAEGELETLSHAEAAARARAAAPLLCHARAATRRLGCEAFPAYDLLELFAFVRPARFVAPTPRGLAAALALPEPRGDESAAAALGGIARALLAELTAGGPGAEARAVAWTMARGGWPWGPAVLAALGVAGADPTRGGRATGLAVWERLPEWSEHAPEPRPGTEAVTAAEARTRLAALLDEEAEARPQQSDYASAVAQAFAPRDSRAGPNLVLAEAGTGVGKTLGYLAPASLWAERNHGPVWISTYTRNLQHQIDAELDRVYPRLDLKARKVVIRKGRENYLCLLNFEEAVAALPQRPGEAAAVGLMARWARKTRDGDMVGGDFPGWLADLAGPARTLGLTDRRGECVYAACQHYRKCFIERGIRKARRAEIVVANHALVMIQAALNPEDGALPTHLVFDEGHHIFDAADGAFAAHLSGREGWDLRRWLLGSEAGGRRGSRHRGLARRVEDLVADDEAAREALDAVLGAARALPGEGWAQRLTEGRPRGPAEAFLGLARQQVYARAAHADGPYSLETEPRPPIPGLVEAAAGLAEALDRIRAPLEALDRRLAERLDEEADSLDSDQRRRIEATRRGIERHGRLRLSAWATMLRDLEAEPPEETIDWLAVERIDGRDIDLGLFRHWIDPTRPFAEAVLARTQGAVVTSATLTDGSGEAEQDWAAAEARSGAAHLATPALRARVPSPFDYAGRTRVLIVGDLRKDDMDLVASAYRELFLAAAGGALGLFTAISRLRAVHQRIAPAIDRAGLPLYAQHVDRIDTATLVDIFRAEPESCLLGTDAVRDGVDVPGEALRLIVFDRVPWPRPDIRHRARRQAFGGRRYDDRLTRLKLKQAYGRLIRRADDRGVFVLLDGMMPSRLLGAFPEGVEARRVGLAEAVAVTRDFIVRG